MYAQATIHTVVKTCIKSGTEAVKLLGVFENIYAPIFAALNAWLLELGDGQMLTPEELAPILERLRGQLPIDGPASLPDSAVAPAAAKKVGDDLNRVVSNLKRQLNTGDLKRFNRGGARARAAAAAAAGGGDARGGAVSSGGGVERTFGGAKKAVKKVVKRVARKAAACVPRRRSRSASSPRLAKRFKGGMTSAADDDPSCKEMVAGGRTNPRTGVPLALKANISQCMNQNALKQLKIGR